VSLEDTAFFQRQLIREMNHWLPLSHELESVPEVLYLCYYFDIFSIDLVNNNVWLGKGDKYGGLSGEGGRVKVEIKL
jgi:hypothetical protein